MAEKEKEKERGGKRALKRCAVGPASGSRKNQKIGQKWRKGWTDRQTVAQIGSRGSFLTAAAKVQVLERFDLKEQHTHMTQVITDHNIRVCCDQSLLGSHDK